MALDTEAVIEESLNDAILDDETPADTAADDATPAEGNDEPAVEAKADDQPESAEVVAPAAKEKTEEVKPAATDDEFAKKHGISAVGVTGRENRIPYSRVKKIIEKNEKDTVARVTKELEAKLGAGGPEVVGKIKDYEGRLEKVAQFEQVMTTDPRQFLGMLSQIPAYKEFFEFVNKAIETQGTATPETPSAAATPVSEDMPQPDRVLPDGSRVYSMDGLKSLMAWQGQQVENRVNKQWQETVDKRFGPMEKAYQSQEYMAKLVPEIDKQISEARKWPNFSELEQDIVKILNENPTITLEGAYRQSYHANVVPKLQTDRNKIRTEILAEIKKQPAVTGAPAGQPRPKTTVTAGPRDMADVIKGSLEEAGILGR